MAQIKEQHEENFGTLYMSNFPFRVLRRSGFGHSEFIIRCSGFYGGSGVGTFEVQFLTFGFLFGRSGFFSRSGFGYSVFIFGRSGFSDVRGFRTFGVFGRSGFRHSGFIFGRSGFFRHSGFRHSGFIFGRSGFSDVRGSSI